MASLTSKEVNCHYVHREQWVYFYMKFNLVTKIICNAFIEYICRIHDLLFYDIMQFCMYFKCFGGTDLLHRQGSSEDGGSRFLRKALLASYKTIHYYSPEEHNQKLNRCGI
jgi:hypothetical protein